MCLCSSRATTARVPVHFFCVMGFLPPPYKGSKTRMFRAVTRRRCLAHCPHRAVVLPCLSLPLYYSNLMYASRRVPTLLRAYYYVCTIFLNSANPVVSLSAQLGGGGDLFRNVVYFIALSAFLDRSAPCGARHVMVDVSVDILPLLFRCSIGALTL